MAKAKVIDPKTGSAASPVALDRLREAARERRGFYNPLSWLTPQGMENLEDEGERGRYTTLQWVRGFIERRWHVLIALKARRQSALGKLDWQTKCVDDSILAKAQEEELKLFFGKIKNLKAAIKHLSLATFRKYAHLQIITEAKTGHVVRLDPVPQWHFKRDGIYGDWRFCVSDSEPGEVIASDGWVVRELDECIDAVACEEFIKFRLADADYSSAVEDAGIMGLFMEMPQGVTPQQKEEFEEMAEMALSSMRGLIPSGTKPHLIGNTSGGAINLHDSRIKGLEERVILMGTGGMLTMLAGPGGLGDGGSSTHDDAFNDLAIAEAMEISEVLQETLAVPWLKARFGEDAEILAYFEIAAPDQSDLDSEAKRLALLKAAGHRAKSSWVAEKFGVELAPDPTETNPPGHDTGKVTNAEKPAKPVKVRAVPTRDEATADLLKALGNDVQPAFEAIAELLRKEELDDVDFADLLELLDSTGQGKPLEDAFETFYATAMSAGWAGEES